MHILCSSWLIWVTCKTPDEDINKRREHSFPHCKRGDISQLLYSASHTLSSWRDHCNTPKQCFCSVFLFSLGELDSSPSCICTWHRLLKLTKQNELSISHLTRKGHFGPDANYAFFLIIHPFIFIICVEVKKEAFFSKINVDKIKTNEKMIHKLT